MESLTFEWVDPVPSASDLPPTQVMVLHYHERFGTGAVQDWWRELG
ncbi:MAG: hypothetical protein ABW195_05445 [Ilumatobacteraceae bacterium]